MRDLFIKDFGWKIFSLLLAAFIWYTVHKIIFEEPRTAAISAANSSVVYGAVPVAVLGASADTPLYRVNSNTVSVTVSGPPEVMAVLEKNQIHAAVDVSEMDNPTKAADQPVDVSVPWGVMVINVEPARLTVTPPKH